MLIPVDTIAHRPPQLIMLKLVTELLYHILFFFHYYRCEHSDYEPLKAALSCMRDIAALINERKRKMESMEKLVAWQESVQDWEVNFCEKTIHDIIEKKLIFRNLNIVQDYIFPYIVSGTRPDRSEFRINTQH